LGFKITFTNKGDFYRIILEYKHIRAGVNCPKGQFKDGAYKVIKTMSNEIFIKGETK
jgi:hypothetical protein